MRKSFPHKRYFQMCSLPRNFETQDTLGLPKTAPPIEWDFLKNGHENAQFANATFEHISLP